MVNVIKEFEYLLWRYMKNKDSNKKEEIYKEGNDLFKRCHEDRETIHWALYYPHEYEEWLNKAKDLLIEKKIQGFETLFINQIPSASLIRQSVLMPDSGLFLSSNSAEFDSFFSLFKNQLAYLKPDASHTGIVPNIREEISLKTLNIKIQGCFMSKGKDKPKKVFNSTDEALIYFLYLKSVENKNECFQANCLVVEIEREMGKKTEEYIKNRIVLINKFVKELIVKGKTNIDNFIKYERGRGYHINPKILI